MPSDASSQCGPASVLGRHSSTTLLLPLLKLLQRRESALSELALLRQCPASGLRALAHAAEERSSLLERRLEDLGGELERQRRREAEVVGMNDRLMEELEITTTMESQECGHLLEKLSA